MDRDIVERFKVFADITGESAERMIAWSLARIVEAALWALTRGEVRNEWFEDAVRLASHL